MIAVLSQAYFQSDNCKDELAHMYQREKISGFRTDINPAGLIVPVLIDRPDHFPAEVRKMQYVPPSDFPHPFIVKDTEAHSQYAAFLKENAFPAIKGALDTAPPFDPLWEEIDHAEVEHLFEIQPATQMTLPSIMPLEKS